LLSLAAHFFHFLPPPTRTSMIGSGPGEARTILLPHIISASPSKQPLMVRTFLKVYMELGSYLVSARTNKGHHHHTAVINTHARYCSNTIATQLPGPMPTLTLVVVSARTNKRHRRGRRRGGEEEEEEEEGGTGNGMVQQIYACFAHKSTTNLRQIADCGRNVCLVLRLFSPRPSRKKWETTWAFA
jgi:hypothetical protein